MATVTIVYVFVQCDSSVVYIYAVFYTHRNYYSKGMSVVHVVITRSWLLLVTSMKCCHGNGNVGLLVCAKFH